jgi:hypothetical protein
MRGNPDKPSEAHIRNTARCSDDRPLDCYATLARPVRIEQQDMGVCERPGSRHKRFILERDYNVVDE